jgi:hypothetical protein
MLKYCFVVSYLVKTTLPDGLSFTAYTCAGELPSCAFGFNSNGVVIKRSEFQFPNKLLDEFRPVNYRFLTQAFTLDSVPPVRDEIVAGAIARNFVSRDLLEAKNLEDAIQVLYVAREARLFYSLSLE